MSESVQLMSPATAGAKQTKLSPLDTGGNPASTDDTAGFNAVFASYIESGPTVAEQKLDENIAEMLAELLPQEMLEAGNTLPADDTLLMWQSLMQIQPAGSGLPAATINLPLQTSNVVDRPRSFAFSTPSLQQNYLQTDVLKTPGAEQGLAFNKGNIITNQLAAAQINPVTHEAMLFTMNEQPDGQLLPVQSHNTNTTLTSGMAAVGLGTATQAANTQTQMAPLNLGQNAWETNLGTRLQMLVGQNVQTAEIRLDPPELGALDIKIKISNDVASVNITSPHSNVREALETAVPRLREMFAESGLSLGDVNVRQESFAQRDNLPGEQQAAASGSNDADFSEEPTVLTRNIVSDSLLDTYA